MINAVKKLVYLTRKKSNNQISIDEEFQLNSMLDNFNITYDELKDVCCENKKNAVCHASILILLKDKKYFLIGFIVLICLIVVSKKYEKADR